MTTDITLGALPDDEAAADLMLPGRDLEIVARYMIPTDAHLARGFLVSAGIPAVVADNNHVQAYEWLAPAMGGVRVLAPLQYVEEAKRLLEAREQGDFALDDDADVGSAED